MNKSVLLTALTLGAAVVYCLHLLTRDRNTVPKMKAVPHAE
jgi:uncharacterized membrane protein YdfJ with MMPL/SSD domain